jgi:hypothetical protein
MILADSWMDWNREPVRDLLIDGGSAGVVRVRHLRAREHVRHAAMMAVSARALVSRGDVQVVQAENPLAVRIHRVEDGTKRGRSDDRSLRAVPHALGHVDDEKARRSRRRVRHPRTEDGGSAERADAAEERAPGEQPLPVHSAVLHSGLL